MISDAFTVLKEKHSLIYRLLFDEYVLVHVNPLVPGLEIPDYLKTRPTVTLKLSKFFHGQLDLQEDKIITTLLFGDFYAECVVPLDSIWGATSIKGKNTFWDDSSPGEMFKELLVQQQNAEHQADKIERKDKIAKSKAVKSPPKKGHLTRVK